MGATIGTAILTAAAVGSKVLGASKAAGAAKDAHAQNAALFREMFATAEGHVLPYIGRGDTAGGMYLDALLGGPKAASAFDTFKRSAGYESNLAAGVDAVNTNAANRNLLRSGKTLKNVTDYGQKLNQNYYQSWLSNLALPQQLGAGSASALANMAQGFADLGANNNNTLAKGRADAWAAGTGAVADGLTGFAGWKWPNAG